MAMITGLRENTLFKKYGKRLDDDPFISPTEPFLLRNPEEEEELAKKKREPFVSPTEGTLKPPKIDRGYQPITSAEAKADVKEKDWFTRLREEYKPETEATDRFNRHINEFPERNKPNWKRKLVSAGMGLDARQRVGTRGQEFTARGNPIPTMEAAMYAPSNRKKADWKERGEPLYQAANLERQANINERQLIGQGILAERYENQNKIAQEKNRISDVRAQAYKYKSEGWEIIKAGSRLVAVDTRGNSIDIGESGGMDREEEIRLLGKFNVEAAKQRGVDAEKLANLRGMNRYQDSAGNIFYAAPKDMTLLDAEGNPAKTTGIVREIGTNVPKSDTPKPETQTSIEQHRVNQAVLMKAKYPKYAKNINIDPQGNVTVKPPRPGWFSDPDPNEVRDYNAIQKEIFGIEAPVIPAETKKEPPTQPPLQVKPEATQGIGPQAIPQPKADPTQGGRRYMQPALPVAPPANTGTGGVKKYLQSDAPLNVGPLPAPGNTLQSRPTAEPGHVLMKDNTSGEIFQVPQENLQRALATGKYSQVR